uniref:Uncharacterized protein n=1 Tax=viral metagenome TaxID=1070528 RepID=A0A6H2A4G5_9ZZZZ
MKVSDFKQSKYMKKEDFATPTLATIASYAQSNVAMQGQKPDYRCVMEFQELDKPVVMNTTKLDIIAAITGSDEIDDWIGTKIVLFHDPDIKFGTKKVGGIGVRAPKGKFASQPLSKPKVNWPEDVDADLADGSDTGIDPETGEPIPF